jgi:hypothetical protein
MSKRLPINHQSEIVIYNTDDGKTAVSLYAKDGSIWMNQNQLAQLFDTSKQNISLHIQNIIKEWEISQDSVVKDYLTTASDGKEYSVTFYSLDMILAVGFRVKSKRGTQFRQWANQNLKEYMIKGHLIDTERLKNPDGRPDYFDELLEKIRDIRASEKRFYQKVRDLFTLSSDYDVTDKNTQMFFAEVQNKILYAITGKTAAEIIIERADSNQINMALTNWKWSIVRKQDIYTAKNYLTEDEIDSLNRFIVVFLETAELRAKGRQDITIDFWKENVDKIINLNDKNVLDHKGSISHKEMEQQVEKIYEEFNKRRKQEEAQNADLEDLEEIEEITKKLKK